MDRRTGADRDSSTNLPTGQNSRGYPASTARNPKSNSSRRPDVKGSTGPGLVDVGLQTTREVDPLGYPGSSDRSRFNEGNPSTIPGPDTTNRGYTQVTGANAPRPSRNVSDNRQRYGIDPGTPPQPNGDNTEGPQIPRFGIGTNGE